MTAVECNQPQWVPVAAHSLGNLEWHIMRAMHLAGRCINCGNCATACPLAIPLNLLNQKIAADVKKYFGSIADSSSKCEHVLSTFKPEDKELSAHNPREVQSQRWRQRIMHKFSYMPENQHLLGCVGCGRCSRICPAYMNILLKATALANMEEGETIGFRGPYGNIFPIERWTGKSLLFIAGGIALPPLRCLIWNALDLRKLFKDITIIYGARTVADLVYKYELTQSQTRTDVRLITTVDPGGETPYWKGEIGFVPTVVDKIAPPSKNTIAIVCGPLIMIKYTFPVLSKLGFIPDDIFTTLENRMKCGRCNVGKYYVCKDGPVFTFAQLQEMPPEY